MTVEKPKPKQLLRPITTGAGSAMNQSQFLAITCNSLKAREESRVHGAIGFGFASDWLKNWRESFKPITKRSNRDHVITFDSHLKTALTPLKRQVLITARYKTSTKQQRPLDPSMRNKDELGSDKFGASFLSSFSCLCDL